MNAEQTTAEPIQPFFATALTRTFIFSYEAVPVWSVPQPIQTGFAFFSKAEGGSGTPYACTKRAPTLLLLRA